MNNNINPVNDIDVGDYIVIGNHKYEVLRIDGKLIWYKISYGVGQTIAASVDKVIKWK
jgi:hypothetical protein